jgi:spermidine synthase
VAERAARRERRRQELVSRRAEARVHVGRTGPAAPTRRLALAFLLSGAAGLMHEVVWSRLLGHVFGATALAVSTVLAAFMAGLAIGSWWIGTRAERLADRRRTYAWLEIGIGVAALLVPLLLAAVEPLYAWLWRRTHLSFALFGLIRFVVAGAILLGPTIMMGATFPVLADHLAAVQGRRLAPQWLYTVNLLGAILGAALAGFVLMPTLGVWGTIVAAAALNVGVGVWVLATPGAPEQRPAAEAAPVEQARLPALLGVAAFVSGLTSLATQVAWTRILVLVVGSTTFAFTAVLVVYLTALGAGSAWASRAKRVTLQLAVAHGLMALGTVFAVFCVPRLPYWYLQLTAAWKPTTLAGVVAVSMTVVGAALAWPVLCAGTILPLVLVGAVPAGGRGTGPAVGRIYAVNTVGAILGAVVAGFVLVPHFCTQATLLAVAAFAALLAVVFALAAPGPRWLPPVAVAAALVVGIGILARPAWNFLELHVGVFEPGRINIANPKTLMNEGEKVVYAREGPTASVLVAEEANHERNLLINARGNASDAPGDMTTQVLLAQIPLLLAPEAKDVFVVGWGSGVSLGSALVGPISQLTVSELEPAVIEAATFFHHVNHSPELDPRLRVYEDDARHVLFASPDTYDVILSEPSHPWVSGVANLFTRDFYRLVEARLRPHGVFGQWLQKYQISYETFRSILAAYQSVFPEVMVFNLGMSLDTALVGTREPLRIDLDALERRMAEPATRAELARVMIGTPEDILARFLLGPDAVREMVKGAVANTDDNMYVETNGPREMAVGVDWQPTVARIDAHATPVESVLVNPAALTESRERLTRLVAALRRLRKPVERYEAMLARLGGPG